MKQDLSNAVFRNRFIVPESALDQNGHVNNVVYVQWMQDVAILHAESVDGTRIVQALGATWVVRSHNIEYLVPAFAGDQVIALTWVVDFRRARSRRRYRFIREHDNTLLARGETEWVFVDAVSGRPRAIPVEVARVFPLPAEGSEP
jgi:acyl-CoA thioester hydrolase